MSGKKKILKIMICRSLPRSQTQKINKINENQQIVLHAKID